MEEIGDTNRNSNTPGSGSVRFLNTSNDGMMTSGYKKYRKINFDPSS